jgi:uncharacterized protein (DUF983 family)
MIPIRCKKCGHIQDAGSSLSPNDTCEQCGTPIFGPKARNPTSIVILAVVTLIVAAILGMPKEFLLIVGVLVVFLVINAFARRKR